jgi:hypothetical protein
LKEKLTSFNSVVEIVKRNHNFMKRRALILLMCLVLIGTLAYSQRNEEPSKNASCIYGELGGNSLFFGANYDFRFKGQNGLGMRVGIGFFGGSGGGLLSIPVGLNYLVGKNGPSYFEAGLGATYLSYTGDDFFDGSSGIFMIPTIGYRYQPISKGFTGRVFVGPLIATGADGGWFMYGGISAGYKF